MLNDFQEDGRIPGSTIQLWPFTTGGWVDELSLIASLNKTVTVLHITFCVKGLLDHIRWPPTSSCPDRLHELWRSTCFEMFIAEKEKPKYWEVNLRPDGCWNVYRFDDYRTGMRDELAIAQPTCSIVMEVSTFSLHCSVDLSDIIADSSDIVVGIASVIEGCDGSISYWAIAHSDVKPDFHNRRSFMLKLPGIDSSTTKRG